MEMEIEKVETEFCPENSRKFMGVFVCVRACISSKNAKMAEKREP